MIMVMIMKKIIILFAIIIFPFVFNKNIEQDRIKIPHDSIRIRIIANSNSLKDQLEKMYIKENLQIYLQEILKNAKTKEDTEDIIKSNFTNIEQNISETIKNLNSKTKYTISYGDNYFPEKLFKGITYESGYYESLVITLGQGNGSNWWCVLFPPLCLMETEEQNMNDIEYELFITEILTKYK